MSHFARLFLRAKKNGIPPSTYGASGADDSFEQSW